MALPNFRNLVDCEDIRGSTQSLLARRRRVKHRGYVFARSGEAQIGSGEKCEA